MLKIGQNKETSFFEFWPSWLMYLPVAIQWVFLSVYYRSLTLPFLANPNLTLSGMVGVQKTELMNQAKGPCLDVILPWVLYHVDDQSPLEQAHVLHKQALEKNIDFPLVCKPDIGCRGVGVKLVHDVEMLAGIIETYPEGAPLLAQKLASWELEAGVFYVKNPYTGTSEIASMTFKYLPFVIGDGASTLGELVSKNPRAGQLLHLYQERHKVRWNEIISKDEKVRLVFSASHSKGAIFEDASEHITPALTQKIEEIMRELPNFFYGRLDIKFSDIESLKKGNNLQVVEINGASSESIHIWDKNTNLKEALRALLWQYRTLFKIGAYHRKQGLKAPSLKSFFQHWRKERNLTKYYPLTD